MSAPARDGVPAPVTRAGEAAAARAADRFADAVRAAVPGARVERTGDGVVVTGRGLLAQPLLRWPAGLLR